MASKRTLGYDMYSVGSYNPEMYKTRPTIATVLLPPAWVRQAIELEPFMRRGEVSSLCLRQALSILTVA